MKILIEEQEKTGILEMHSKMKKTKIVNEQVDTQSVQSQLQAFIDDGKVVNGKVVPMNSTNPQLMFAIKQESSITPGKFRYLFIDKRIGTIENGKFIFMKDTVWTPGPAKQKVDPNSGDIEKEIAAGWKKREELKNVSDTELASSYVQHPKYKNLYRLKGLGTDKMGGYDENQQAFIDSWTKANPDAQAKLDVSTYKYNPTAADFATGQWKKNNYFIADGSESFFPADENGVRGLKIYYNWAKISQEPTRENCRAAIKDYATMFALRNSKPSTAQDIATKKAFVQLCKDQPNMKFGGPLSKIDDYLKQMSGGEGGPTRTGEDAKWLLR